MPQSLDMPTVLFLGALVCLTLAGVMVYFSIARKTYPGFHSWTVGFVNVGIGAALLPFRGFLPDFVTIILANLLVISLPFMLTRGLIAFVGIKSSLSRLNTVLLAVFLGIFFWTTYVSPDLRVRVLTFSLLYAFFFGEALYVAIRHIPSILGERNQLLVAAVAFTMLSSLLRPLSFVIDGEHIGFLVNPGAWQCTMVLMTILGAVCITNSLVILNTHRMEHDLNEAKREIESIADQDGLTTLYNRRYFDKILEREFSRLQRVAQPVSLIMADIDCFKDYNDTYGHLAGDDCLKAVARAFKASGVRAADVAVRYGGEEFAMILPNTEAQGAERVAMNLMERIQGMAIPHSASMVADVVTVSIGLSTVIPDGTARPEDLIASADKALYESKLGGRNRIHSQAVKTAA